MMWGQQISQEEPQQKEVWERAGIAIFPHKETAFPAGWRLLSFIFEGCFLMKKLVIMGRGIDKPGQGDFKMQYLRALREGKRFLLYNFPGRIQKPSMDNSSGSSVENFKNQPSKQSLGAMKCAMMRDYIVTQSHQGLSSIQGEPSF